jgi:hypothetical protein
MLLRLGAALLLAVALVAGTASWRERSRIAQMGEVVAARRELAGTPLTAGGTAPQAGISARAPIRVRPAPDRLVRQLRSDAPFQRFSHRCGVCHVTPDPALHTAGDWPAVVSRMSGTIDAAGLLPLRETDREAILKLLAEHASPGQQRPAITR